MLDASALARRLNELSLLFSRLAHRRKTSKGKALEQESVDNGFPIVRSWKTEYDLGMTRMVFDVEGFASGCVRITCNQSVTFGARAREGTVACLRKLLPNPSALIAVIRKPPRTGGGFRITRRGRDLNPRRLLHLRRFQGARIRPLCHLAKIVNENDQMQGYARNAQQ